MNELEEVMAQHTERLIRLAFYYVKDLQGAEDIVQDVFIKFYDNQQNYEERGELKAYLSKLVINKSKDYLRSWTYRKIQVQQKIFAKEAVIRRDMLVQNGVWFPLHGVKDKIAVGKQVNITYTMKDDTISQGYDFAANLDEIEIIE